MRYCVTVGRGMEPFVKKQLEQIQDVKIDGTIIEGKVLFDASNFNKLCNLRCAESLCDRNSLLNSTCETAFNCLLSYGEPTQSRTFRVSLKATGKWRRKIDIEKLSTSIARRIKQMSGFNSSVHFTAIEICIHLSEKYIFIGIPITRERLSKRRYLLNNSLRSTVVDAMLSMANIQDGDIIADLTCGSSSIFFIDGLKRSPLSGQRSAMFSCSSSSNSYISTAILLISAMHLPSLNNMLKLPARLKQHYPISLGTTQAVIVLLANDRE
uniref:THUMP domain-containing protein n=1 Tax=Wuchereria bancrofti TaxID=6293 RepID=A0AAF5Q563_WUCBA